jgi:hypothetical protein
MVRPDRIPSSGWSWADLKGPMEPDDASVEMDDYSALAQRIALSATGVRGSLILSRDGLVLGAFPDEDESLAKAAWLRFAALGDPDRSFVEFQDQIWAFVKRGPYAAFSVADPGTRPGVLVDQMEQVLLTAEDGRARRDTLRVPDAAAAPSGKPRTSLHPNAERPTSEEIAAPAAADVAAVGATAEPQAGGGFWKRVKDEKPDKGDKGDKRDKDGKGSKADKGSRSETPPMLEPRLEAAPEAVDRGSGERPEDDPEVDRVLLAKEFSGLLQVDSSDDEETS